MIVVQVAVAMMAVAALGWGCVEMLRRSRGDGRSALRGTAVPRSAWSTSAGCVLGGLLLLLLLLVPGTIQQVLTAPFSGFGFVLLQDVAPAVAAVVVLAGVPHVLRRPSPSRREASLRPRVLTDFVDRPLLRLGLPALAALTIAGCALWRWFTSAPVWQAWWSGDQVVRHRITMSFRVLGPSPSEMEIAASAVAMVVVLVAAALVLRSVRDAAPAGADLSAGEVLLRKKLARYVIAVATAAQTATAGMLLVSAGGWLQTTETAPTVQLIRHDGASTTVTRTVGVTMLQPEWALATIELGAGLALLVLAVGVALHTVRVVRALSSSPRSAVATAA